MAVINRGPCACCQSVNFSLYVDPATVWISKRTGTFSYADYNVTVYDGSTTAAFWYEEDLMSYATLVGTAGTTGSYVQLTSVQLSFTYNSKNYTVTFDAVTPWDPDGVETSQEYRYEDNHSAVSNVVFTEIP